MQSITLNDGTILDVLWVSVAAGPLTIAVAGDHSVREMAELFGAPSKTTSIGSSYGQTFTGYADLQVINRASAPQGYVTIILARSEE